MELGRIDLGSQFSVFLIHHAGWVGRQHGWVSLRPLLAASVDNLGSVTRAASANPCSTSRRPAPADSLSARSRHNEGGPAANQPALSMVLETGRGRGKATAAPARTPA